VNWPAPSEMEEEPLIWGVDRDPPEPAGPSNAKRLIWIVLSILIILSLVLPWILPYFAPRPMPVRDGLQAMLINLI
jgi:hypothetical protein